eukprot:900747-Prymnesium_polylepis.1
MLAALLDGAGGGSDDHRMKIVTETSRFTEGSTEGASSAPLIATDANSPPRAPPPACSRASPSCGRRGTSARWQRERSGTAAYAAER